MSDESDPQVGALSGNVHTLPTPTPSPRALSRALDALRPDPADEAERRVLARLKPLHTMMIERIDEQAAQLIECERRLRALEAK